MQFAALLALLLLSISVPAEEARRIAITFDDAPRPATRFTGPERARRLIETLAGAQVQATFFCLTDRFDAEGRERIDAYREAGHLIASHSASHPDLDEVGAAAFLADFRRSADVLAAIPGARRWFRYPYLHEGRTPAERDAVREGLADAGYANGYVTVDDYDWYMDRLFQQALAAGKSIDHEKLGEAYVSMLVAAVEFYDGIARRSLGRSPAHVLLLHENDLAALFVGDLVAALRARGWQTVSTDEAYADPIARELPATLLQGQGRVVGLAIDRGYEGARAIWEEEDEIRAEFERAGAWR